MFRSASDRTSGILLFVMGSIRLGCVILDLLGYTSWIREIP